MTEQEMQLQIAIEQGKANTLRQEVAETNKEREYWQHYRIQAAIAAMQAHISDGEHMALLSRNLKHDDEAVSKCIAKAAVMYADALIAELKKKGWQDEQG